MFVCVSLFLFSFLFCWFVFLYFPATCLCLLFVCLCINVCEFVIYYCFFICIFYCKKNWNYIFFSHLFIHCCFILVCSKWVSSYRVSGFSLPHILLQLLYFVCFRIFFINRGIPQAASARGVARLGFCSAAFSFCCLRLFYCRSV